MDFASDRARYLLLPRTTNVVYSTTFKNRSMTAYSVRGFLLSRSLEKETASDDCTSTAALVLRTPDGIFQKDWSHSPSFYAVFASSEQRDLITAS
jgi:heme-degrading monooxygenase HmoA